MTLSVFFFNRLFFYVFTHHFCIASLVVFMAEYVIFSQIKPANLLTICLKVIPSCQLCVDLLNKTISPQFAVHGSWTANLQYKQPQAKHQWMYATGILRASHLLDIISQKDKIQIWRNCELWRFKSHLWEEQEYEKSVSF